MSTTQSVIPLSKGKETEKRLTINVSPYAVDQDVVLFRRVCSSAYTWRSLFICGRSLFHFLSRELLILDMYILYVRGA